MHWLLTYHHIQLPHTMHLSLLYPMFEGVDMTQGVYT